jgi:hypothetical protein
MPPASKRAVPSEAGGLVIPDGTLEALKWLGLLLMTLDHVNKYLLDGSAAAIFAMGRVAMPLFSFVLAYNLARPSTLCHADEIYPRVLKRLAAGALVASVPSMALGGLAGGWWPLNILATFAVAVGVIQLLRFDTPWRKVAAASVAVVGGGLVEYWWPAIAMCVASWHYCQRRSGLALSAWVVATLGLDLDGWAFGARPLVNESLLALLAFPLIFGSSHLDLRFPRLSLFFYAYYPMHLALLWVLRSL